MMIKILSLLKKPLIKKKLIVDVITLFRDWTAERTSYSRDLCEIALAHAIKDKAAYRRGDMIEKRRKLMEDWLKYTEERA